jgi:hypothetical protein
MTLAELAWFGISLNPAIEREAFQSEPPVIARLRSALAPGQRAIGVGEELPPNVLMRYGLDDARNYDSIELRRNLDWLAPLYAPGDEAQTSRRQITWKGVLRARDRLQEASVAAVVGSSRPPAGFSRVERSGEVWIAWLEAKPWVASHSGSTSCDVERGPNTIAIRTEGNDRDSVVIRETWDPGWSARIDGSPVVMGCYQETFMVVMVPPGRHVIELAYQPAEVRWGLFGSTCGLIVVMLVLTSFRRF